MTLPTIQLQSIYAENPSEIVEVGTEIACRHSEFIRETVDSADDEDEEEGKPVCLKVKTNTLRLIVEFMIYYDEHPFGTFPVPLGVSTMEEVVTDVWYHDFLPVEKNDLFELLSAANFMNIKPLLDLCCLKVTFLVAHKGPEEIQELLNLPALTEEELSRARVEHEWLFSEEDAENEAS